MLFSLCLLPLASLISSIRLINSTRPKFVAERTDKVCSFHPNFFLVRRTIKDMDYLIQVNADGGQCERLSFEKIENVDSRADGLIVACVETIPEKLRRRQHRTFMQRNADAALEEMRFLRGKEIVDVLLSPSGDLLAFNLVTCIVLFDVPSKKLLYEKSADLYAKMALSDKYLGFFQESTLRLISISASQKTKKIYKEKHILDFKNLIMDGPFMLLHQKTKLSIYKDGTLLFEDACVLAWVVAFKALDENRFLVVLGCGSILFLDSGGKTLSTKIIQLSRIAHACIDTDIHLMIKCADREFEFSRIELNQSKAKESPFKLSSILKEVVFDGVEDEQREKPMALIDSYFNEPSAFEINFSQGSELQFKNVDGDKIWCWGSGDQFALQHIPSGRDVPVQQEKLEHLRNFLYKAEDLIDDEKEHKEKSTGVSDESMEISSLITSLYDPKPLPKMTGPKARDLQIQSNTMFVLVENNLMIVREGEKDEPYVIRDVLCFDTSPNHLAVLYTNRNSVSLFPLRSNIPLWRYKHNSEKVFFKNVYLNGRLDVRLVSEEGNILLLSLEGEVILRSDVETRLGLQRLQFYMHINYLKALTRLADIVRTELVRLEDGSLGLVVLSRYCWTIVPYLES